jgi:hypothetical protein
VDTVGIRELKAHLSRHLKRVRSGAARDRAWAFHRHHQSGRGSSRVDWAYRLAAEGRALERGKPWQLDRTRHRGANGQTRCSRIAVTLYLDFAVW